MKVTRDVVMDLLPLYVAGEASADTRALVEEFLRQDPELERRARETRLDPLSAAGAPRAVVPPDLEMRSLRRTRGLLRWQRLTYAWALTLSLLSLSSAISSEGGRISVRPLLFDYPGTFIPCIVLAVCCWGCYIVLRRHARVT